MTLTINAVDQAMRALDYPEICRDLIQESIRLTGWVDEAVMPSWDLSVFDCALAPPGCNRVISPMGHIQMVAAIQPFVSGAVSKTVNVPSTYTVSDIEDTYYRAWQSRLKCVSIYRDGSKGSQPIILEKPEEDSVAKCIQCGNAFLLTAGTCAVCPECGTPQGGCS